MAEDMRLVNALDINSISSTYNYICYTGLSGNDSGACCVQLMVDGSFAVSRRTWIDTEGSRWTKRPWSVGLDADNISLLIGVSLSLSHRFSLTTFF